MNKLDNKIVKIKQIYIFFMKLIYNKEYIKIINFKNYS